LWLRCCVRSVAPLAVAASVVVAGAASRADDSYWNSGTAAGNFWSTGTNWSNGVPTSTTNALTTSSGASIILGSGAQAKTLFVDGPLGGESTLSAGNLTLSDQLWINIASGTTQATTVPLRLLDSGSAPVSVTANNVTLGAELGKQGGVILDSRPAGNVSLNVTNTLTIGYRGDGSYVRNLPVFGSAHGTSAITAGTIQVSVMADAGNLDYNRIETTNASQTVTATNLQLGIAGQQAVATAQAGSWSIGNTVLGVDSTARGNEITVSDGGSFTNSGAFTVGVDGHNNFVNVGYIEIRGNVGTFQLTGTNDLVIGSGASSYNNSFNVYNPGSTLSANGNVVVGLNGNNNDFRVSAGSTASSGGARLGVNAGSHDNTVTLGGGATWTMDGSVRVGDKGTNNLFLIDGSTVTLTGTGKNFYVGYDKSASNNALAVLNSGTLSVKATGADLVVSGNVTGTGANSTGNILAIAGGVVDANRTLVGDGGQIWGFEGTIKGDTIIDAGGSIGPGEFGATWLSFTDNLDLSRGGLLNMTTSGTDSSFIDIGGTLTLGGSSSLLMTMETQIAGVAYIIAHYNSLAGEFATVNGLPDASWHVDYNYLGLNEIAIVSNVPEIDPASFGSAFALLMGSLGLVERRTRRRIGLKTRA